MLTSRCLNSVLQRSRSGGRSSPVAAILNSSQFNNSTSLNNSSSIDPSVQRSSGQSQHRNMATSSKQRRTITLDSMNPNVIKMEYAVRGPLVIRAGEIEKEIKQVRKSQENNPLMLPECGTVSMPSVIDPHASVWRIDNSFRIHRKNLFSTLFDIHQIWKSTFSDVICRMAVNFPAKNENTLEKSRSYCPPGKTSMVITWLFF